VRLGYHVVAGDCRVAGVGGDQGGEDVDGGGLAGAVRAEEADAADMAPTPAYWVVAVWGGLLCVPMARN
jgi:hypothetical protein